MPPPPSRDPRAATGVLHVGPGPRAHDLGTILAALGASRGVETRVFGDLAELAHAGGSALLLLDVDATPLEDVGYVRRILAANARVELVLFGVDPRSRTARALGSQRFLHWPPDVDELTALVERSSGHSNTDRAASREQGPLASSAQLAPSTDPHTMIATPLSSSTVSSRADVGELEQVRAILEQAAEAEFPSATAESSARALHEQPLEFGPATDIEAFSEDLAGSANPFPSTGDFERAGSPPKKVATPRRPELDAERASDKDRDFGTDQVEDDAPRAAIDAPPWWRAQVADLADAAQRIDLSVKMLAQAAPEIDEGELDDARARLRELEGEVARLLQFTRTLGYVAAPPPAGSQTFDLGEIVHLFAAGLAQSGPEAPRCQFKTAPGATVRSDRQLLSQALDAVFFLVRCTSRKGDLVRAQVQSLDADGRVWIEMALDFPSGPLEGLPEQDVVSPYSLTDLFPELGPNALAAAAGIVTGQGGRLSLVNRAPGRMTWHLRLPRAGS